MGKVVDGGKHMVPNSDTSKITFSLVIQPFPSFMEKKTPFLEISSLFLRITVWLVPCKGQSM